MGAVLMNEEAIIVVSIKGIPTNVWAAIYQEDALVAFTCETLREDAARETGADDQPIIHEYARSSRVKTWQGFGYACPLIRRE
jgi:hypothetical protein